MGPCFRRDDSQSDLAVAAPIADYLSVLVAARIGAQRATSDRTKRSNAVGLRSAFVGIAPPSWANVWRTEASSSALSRASASLATTAGEVPLGAKSPAQTLIS